PSVKDCCARAAEARRISTVHCVHGHTPGPQTKTGNCVEAATDHTGCAVAQHPVTRPEDGTGGRAGPSSIRHDTGSSIVGGSAAAAGRDWTVIRHSRIGP